MNYVGLKETKHIPGFEAVKNINRIVLVSVCNELSFFKFWSLTFQIPFADCSV